MGNCGFFDDGVQTIVYADNFNFMGGTTSMFQNEGELIVGCNTGVKIVPGIGRLTSGAFIQIETLEPPVGVRSDLDIEISIGKFKRVSEVIISIQDGADIIAGLGRFVPTRFIDIFTSPPAAGGFQDVNIQANIIGFRQEGDFILGMNNGVDVSAAIGRIVAGSFTKVEYVPSEVGSMHDLDIQVSVAGFLAPGDIVVGVPNPDGSGDTVPGIARLIGGRFIKITEETPPPDSDYDLGINVSVGELDAVGNIITGISDIDGNIVAGIGRIVPGDGISIEYLVPTAGPDGEEIIDNSELHLILSANPQTMPSAARLHVYRVVTKQVMCITSILSQRKMPAIIDGTPILSVTVSSSVEAPEENSVFAVEASITASRREGCIALFIVCNNAVIATSYTYSQGIPEACVIRCFVPVVDITEKHITVFISGLDAGPVVVNGYPNEMDQEINMIGFESYLSVAEQTVE